MIIYSYQGEIFARFSIPKFVNTISQLSHLNIEMLLLSLHMEVSGCAIVFNFSLFASRWRHHRMLNANIIMVKFSTFDASRVIH